MSILRTNQIQDTGTNVAANISGGTVTFTNPPVGAFINQVDQFRLTADLINPGDAAITSNFERVDNATFSKIGTGMTESSGIFTFPSTGIWFIKFNTIDDHGYVVPLKRWLLEAAWDEFN